MLFCCCFLGGGGEERLGERESEGLRDCVCVCVLGGGGMQGRGRDRVRYVIIKLDCVLL